LHIHEDDLRSQFERFTHSLHAICGLSNYLQVRVAFQEASQSRSRDSLGFYDEDTHLFPGERP
jgi:hypothetical protein